MSIEETKQQPLRIAENRRSVIDRANRIKNVSEACRQGRMDRASFYKWKKRYEENGLGGLMNRNRRPHSHPATIPDSMKEKILEIVLKYPNWGCDPISRTLKRQGISISSPTVQKFLIRKHLAKMADRVHWLEERWYKGEITPSTEQEVLVTKYNPEIKDGFLGPPEPGFLLDQDVKPITVSSAIDRLYLYCVIDIYCSYGFGLFHAHKNPETAVRLLYEIVLPQYAEWGIKIRDICTNSSRLFRGRLNHPYVTFLKNNSIKHSRDDIDRTSGTVQRFVDTIKKEFLPEIKKEGFTSIQKFQREFDVWLRYYNYERPHLCFRNQGKRPFDQIKSFIEK